MLNNIFQNIRSTEGNVKKEVLGDEKVVINQTMLSDLDDLHASKKWNFIFIGYLFYTRCKEIKDK